MQLVKLSRQNQRKIIKVAALCFSKKYVDEEVRPWYGRKLNSDYMHNDILEYFIAFHRGKPIGITGFYHVKGENVFWLGYFAVIPSERKKWTVRNSAHGLRAKELPNFIKRTDLGKAESTK